MKGIYFFIAILLSGSFLSCSKQESTDMDTATPTGYLNLVIDASYADVEETPLDKKASVGSGSSSNVVSARLNDDIISEFSVEDNNRLVSVGKGNATIQKLASKEGVMGSDVLGKLKFKKLEAGVVFMVLVFDDKDHHVATQKVVMGEGDRTPISIPFKKDYVVTTDNHYRVVAFTYNTKNPEDFDGLNLDPSQTNDNPEIAIPSDKEFFYYNGDAPIDPHPTNPDTRQLISIKFVPQTVKVGITIDGRGLNAKVLKMSGRFSDFSIRNTGTMNLKLNQVSRSTVDNVNFPYDFSVTGEGDTLSVARYVYMDESDGTQTLNNLSVTLTELVVQRDGEPATTVLSTPATKAKVYSFGSLSLKKGKFYNGRIHLLTGFEIDGIVWAYGNLYYDKADVGNEFKIRKSPDEGKFASTDYWMFSSSLSGDSFKILSDSTKKIIGSGYNYTYTSVGLNPCAKVYPYNTWRIPSEAEAKKFLSNTQSGLDFRFVKPESGTRYVEFKKTGTTSPVIRFYAHSYYENEKLITEGFMGLFWLKDNVGSLQKSLVYTIVDDFAEWQQTGDKGVKNGSNTDAITGYGTALFDPKMNIRCVRDLRN